MSFFLLKTQNLVYVNNIIVMYYPQVEQFLSRIIKKFLFVQWTKFGILLALARPTERQTIQIQDCPIKSMTYGPHSIKLNFQRYYAYLVVFSLYT